MNYYKVYKDELEKHYKIFKRIQRDTEIEIENVLNDDSDENVEKLGDKFRLMRFCACILLDCLSDNCIEVYATSRKKGSIGTQYKQYEELED